MKEKDFKKKSTPQMEPIYITTDFAQPMSRGLVYFTLIGRDHLNSLKMQSFVRLTISKGLFNLLMTCFIKAG